jgi:ankyrin repeat protein
MADTDGVPALHKAVANGHVEVARILLEREEISINAKNKGTTICPRHFLDKRV